LALACRSEKWPKKKRKEKKEKKGKCGAREDKRASHVSIDIDNNKKGVKWYRRAFRREGKERKGC